LVDLSGDEAFDMYRVLYSLDDWTAERSLLATRGDHLALVEEHTWFVDGSAGESEVLSLSVDESDADGLIVAITTFELDELDAAYDALDARYVELGGPDLRPYAQVLNTHDWELFASFFDEHASIEDRRRVGDGTMDRVQLVAYQRAMLELAPDVSLRVDHIDAVSPNASLIVERFVGTRDGGPFEMPAVSLACIGSTGRVSSVTLYDIDDLDTARADYARLTAPSLDDHLPNLAWRVCCRLTAAANARDWDAYKAAVAHAVEYSDRRTGLAAELTGDETRALWQAMFKVDELRLNQGLVATRGDRLALIRGVAFSRDGNVDLAEAAGVSVIETDDELLVRNVTFDPEEMAAALDELDAQFTALGGNPLIATMRHAFDTRDWDTLASVFTDDCTIVDSRTAGWGAIDRDVFVAYQRSVAELSDDAHLWVDHLREHGNVSISTGRAFGTNAGGVWEIAFVTIGVTNADGRTRHFETYELDDMAVAVQRFHELTAADGSESVANAAWRAACQQARSVNTRDWDGYLATLTADSEVEDRRSGVAVFARGDEAVLAVHRVAFTLDRCRLERELLAMRGEQLALGRTTVTFEDRDAGPAEVTCLNLFEVDAHGQITTMLAFDVDDTQTALAELEARYRALSDLRREPNLAWRTVTAQGRAVDAQRWDEFAATLAPDFEQDDRRSVVGRVARGPDAIALVQWMFSLDDMRLETTPITTRGDRLVLVRARATFRDGVGGPAEVVCLTVHQVNERGLMTHTLQFDEANSQGALAELDARYRALAEARTHANRV
jgi:hypothetical protein